eukprot:6208509-Pleurochrysis_carterae.AAC.3
MVAEESRADEPKATTDATPMDAEAAPAPPEPVNPVATYMAVLKPALAVLDRLVSTKEARYAVHALRSLGTMRKMSRLWSKTSNTKPILAVPQKRPGRFKVGAYYCGFNVLWAKPSAARSVAGNACCRRVQLFSSHAKLPIAVKRRATTTDLLLVNIRSTSRRQASIRASYPRAHCLHVAS